MNAFYQRLANRVRRWLSTWRPARPIVDVEAAPRRARRRAEVPDDVEENGQFYFRGAILEQLDLYRTYVKRMRKSDPDAFALYSKVGMQILPRASRARNDGLNEWWTNPKNRPGFGAVSFVGKKLDMADDGKDLIYGKFCYFQKLAKPPARVQKTNGMVYSFTVYHDESADRLQKLPYGLSSTFYIGIDEAGRVSLLRTRVSKRYVLGNSGLAVSRPEWVFPEWVNTHSRAQEYFALIADFYFRSNLGTIQVRATKGGVSILFSIAENRAPYFFRDRDDMAGKKKIFHAVRAHSRQLESGRAVTVKMHFRGARNFVWNGYEITISVPGLHHGALHDFKGGLIELEDGEPLPPEHLDAAQLGAAIAGHLDGDQSKTRRAA